MGWRQQTGLGRQPMYDLLICIDGARIRGTGTDIIAAFTLDGRLRMGGAVEMLKRSQLQHSVLYVGQ